MKTLILEVPFENAQQLEESLAFYEIEGVEIINPRDCSYNHLLWQEDEAPTPLERNDALFKIYAEERIFTAILKDLQHLYAQSRMDDIEDKDWNQLWADQFPGVEMKRVFIRPPWVEKKKDKLDLIIEPGMAFGTGSHETTLLCMEILEEYVQPGDDLIDVGTGSGILAILAKKLGAKNVYARELDETALENAILNAELNQTEIRFSHGDLLTGFEHHVQVMVANILPPILVRMVEDAARLLDGKGILILSGILEKRVPELLASYGRFFDLLEERVQGEWVVLVLKRK